MTVTKYENLVNDYVANDVSPFNLNDNALIELARAFYDQFDDYLYDHLCDLRSLGIDILSGSVDIVKLCVDTEITKRQLLNIINDDFADKEIALRSERIRNSIESMNEFKVDEFRQRFF